MHPVERRGLGCADVGAHVLDRVVAERDELAVLREPASTVVTRPVAAELAARCSSRSSVQRTGTPSARDASPSRTTYGSTAALIPNEPPESGGVRRRSRSPRRPSAAAATPWSVNGPWKFAQAVSLGRLVPVADDAEALERHAREPRDAERLAHDEIGPFERLVDVAVVERAVVDRRRLEGVENGIERLVVDGDELGRVLGDVPVARDDDGEGLADVPRGSGGRGVVGTGDSMPAGNGFERRTTSSPVSTPRTPSSASAAVGSTSPSRGRAASGRSPHARRAGRARGRR